MVRRKQVYKITYPNSTIWPQHGLAVLDQLKAEMLQRVALHDLLRPAQLT
jgi:hypothetical protein